MYHPEYSLLESLFEAPIEPLLTPVYSTTEGISQQRIRLVHEQAHDYLRNDQVALTDLFPPEWLAYWRLPNLKESLLFLHQPPQNTSLESLEAGNHPAQLRLILEELLAHQLSLHKIRAAVQADRAPAISASKHLQSGLLNNLPFSPTGAQQRVTQEILQDIQQPYPMLRLVQGDVGSGKTLVAALAACSAFEAGYQVALMAATDILAEQHLQNLSSWFEPLGVRMGWLAGKVKGKARAQALADISSAAAQLVVGTHALFQDEVRFAKLGLIIIDEQHRFGRSEEHTSEL